MKDCNKLYSSFNQYLGLAHYQNYFEFKRIMRNNFQIMKYNLGKTDDEDALKLLLIHFKEQLQFFEKHPFSCNSEEFIVFENKHMPYQGKFDSIVHSVKEEQWKAHSGPQL